MYLQLSTIENDPDLNIDGASILPEEPQVGDPVQGQITGPLLDRYRFIEDTDLPTDVETFLNNFEKYEIAGGFGGNAGVIQLKSGEVVTPSRYTTDRVDDTIPKALERANKATIFENL